MTALEVVPFADRLANAAVSYVRTLGKMFWPRDLSVHYPHPNMAGGTPWEPWQVAGATLALALLSALVFRFRRRRCLPVGWLWYLGTLAPMIGIVQVGSHAMADRFTYIPSIGVLLAVVWLAGDLVRGRRASARAAQAAGVLAVVAYAAVAWREAGAWRDSIALGERALAAGNPSPKTLHNLGLALAQAGRYEEALPRLEEAVRRKPDHARAWSNLGLTQQRAGRTEEAIARFERAIALDGNDARFWSNLSAALARAGRFGEAIDAARRAVVLAPDDAAAHNDLGILLARSARLDEAAACFRRAVEIDRTFADAAENLRQVEELREGR